MDASSRGRVHLLIGPVGSGKSTLGSRRAIASGALFLDLDEWMVRLYGADVRPADDVLSWYLERRERCRSLLWDTGREAARHGLDVWLELGLVSRTERESMYGRVRADDLELHVVLLDAPHEVRRDRVEARNASGGKYVQQVPPKMFELASDAWEPLDDEERRVWGIEEA